MSDTLISSTPCNGLTLELHYDPDPRNPRREFDTLGRLLFRSSRDLPRGDGSFREDPEEFLYSLLPGPVLEALERLDAHLETLQERRERARRFPPMRFLTEAEADLLRSAEDALEALANGLDSTTVLHLLGSDADECVRVALAKGDRATLQRLVALQRTNAYVRSWGRFERRYAFLSERRSKIFLEALHRDWVILNVHEHGSLSTSPVDSDHDFGDGFIWMSREVARREGVPDPVAYLNAELAEYSAFCTGEVYGFVIEDADGVERDSCWGFYEEAYALQKGRAACGLSEEA